MVRFDLASLDGQAECSVRGVNYFCRLATTISAGEGVANESAGDRGGLG